MDYNEQILTNHARDLDRRAKNIQISFVFFGAVAGLIAAGLIVKTGPDMEIAGIFVGVLTGLFVASLGNSRAMMLRIQAQNILVLCQIERNTRPIKTASIKPAEKPALIG
jgi:hypothetical protein